MSNESFYEDAADEGAWGWAGDDDGLVDPDEIGGWGEDTDWDALEDVRPAIDAEAAGYRITSGGESTPAFTQLIKLLGVELRGSREGRHRCAIFASYHGRTEIFRIYRPPPSLAEAMAELLEDIKDPSRPALDRLQQEDRKRFENLFGGPLLNEILTSPDAVVQRLSQPATTRKKSPIEDEAWKLARIAGRQVNALGLTQIPKLALSSVDAPPLFFVPIIDSSGGELHFSDRGHAFPAANPHLQKVPCTLALSQAGELYVLVGTEVRSTSARKAVLSGGATHVLPWSPREQGFRRALSARRVRDALFAHLDALRSRQLEAREERESRRQRLTEVMDWFGDEGPDEA